MRLLWILLAICLLCFTGIAGMAYWALRTQCVDLRCFDDEAFPLKIDEPIRSVELRGNDKACFGLGPHRSGRLRSTRSGQVVSDLLGQEYLWFGSEFVEVSIGGRPYIIRERALNIATWQEGCGGHIIRNVDGKFEWRIS